MPSQFADRIFLPILLLAAAGAFAIGLASSSSLETCWDERIDIEIADGLRAHPLGGEEPALDASQMRLPMYANALVFAVTGRDDLRIARIVSLVIGAITVIGTGLLGRRLFDAAIGAIAAILIALSPYFLSFARIAMTEGDVFFACAVVWTLWAFHRYLLRATPATWLVAAILLGLTLGAKTFGLWLFAALPMLAIFERGPTTDLAGARSDVRRLSLALIVCSVAVPIVVVVAYYSTLAASIGWGVLLVLWLVAIACALLSRILSRSRRVRLAGMFALAVTTWAVLMPAHVVQTEIARSFAQRLLGWDHQAPLVLLADHLRLYCGILWIKLSIPLGILTTLGLLYGATQCWGKTEWRFCVVPIVTLIAALCLLPLRQTFYLMGIYPLLMIVTAAAIVLIGRWAGGVTRGLRIAWTLAATLMLGHLGYTTWREYPYYNLAGYGLVGDRWLGAESRGYRNLIQTPSDGVESLIRWCNESPDVRPGAKVVSFLWEDMPGHIVDGVLPQNPRFSLIRRGLTRDSDALQPQPDWRDADFILLHLNNILGYGDRPPDAPKLEALERVFAVAHTVRRGNLAVGWVYRRR